MEKIVGTGSLPLPSHFFYSLSVQKDNLVKTLNSKIENSQGPESRHTLFSGTFPYRENMGMPLPPPPPSVGREETKFLIVIPFLSGPFPLLIIAVFKVLFPLRENYISVQMTSLAVDPFPLFA